MILYFIRKTIVTICLNLSILLIGFLSFDKIANEFIPAIEVPAVGVVFPTTFLHHERVSHDLIEPVEKALLATGDVEKIETTLDKDRAVLFIFYKWSIPPEECLQRARQTVSAIARPDGVLEPIFVLHRPTLSPIYRVAFSGQSIGQLTNTLQDLAGEIERQPGVSSVNLNGGSPEKGLLSLDAVKSSGLGVNVTSLLDSAINTWSFRHFIPFKDETSDVFIRYPLDSLESLKTAPVFRDNQKSIPLKWISKVEKAQSPAKVLYGKGQDALILEITKAPGSDAIQIVKSVESKTQAILKSNPSLKATVIYNEAEKIEQAQSGVFQNFAIGVTLNSLILIIFLGSIIGAIVASCVFPTAILGTLYIMDLSGISLNIFALNGFSLASGMITDASIVVLESIMRRFQKGEDIEVSCNKGTKDVMLGVFASTLTTAAVIVPISMQTGVSSKLFSDLGITLVTTQFVCLIAVFTFVPWLCSKILSEQEIRPAPIDYLFRGSSWLCKKMTSFGHRTLKKSVNDIRVRVFVPLVLTCISVSMLFLMPDSEFLPNVAANTYSISLPIKRIKLLDQGDDLRKKMSDIVGNFTGVNWAITYNDLDSLKATVNLADTSQVPRLVQLISQALTISESKVIALPLGPTPPTEPMSYDGYYYIRKDLDPKLRAQAIREFCSHPGIMDCHTHEHYIEPKWILKPKPLELVRASSNIPEATLNVASFTKNLDIASITNLPFSFPVELKVSNLSRVVDYPLLLGKKDLSLGRLQTGFENVFASGSNVQFRKNSVEYLPFYFRVDGLTIGNAVTWMWELNDKLNIPRSSILPMGTLETMNETFDKMINALILSGVLILIILVIQFQSLSQALVIMYSMPLAVGGAIVGLHVMEETLNVGVIVGFILLIGIIVNNGILLTDAINQRITSGMNLLDAIMNGVESRTRPILMTTFSTVFGMLPTLVLEAEGKELYQGMAIVNIFGMIFGTFLTLVITPVVIRIVMEFSTTNKKGTA